jgi:hypothetical protein
VTLIETQVYKVHPNSIRTIHFELACTSNVYGSFFTGGGLSNHVVVYLMTLEQANLLKSGSNTTWHYSSGDTYTGSIQAEMGEGSYYVAIKNGNTPAKEKNVELELKSKCL